MSVRTVVEAEEKAESKKVVTDWCFVRVSVDESN